MTKRNNPMKKAAYFLWCTILVILSCAGFAIGFAVGPIIVGFISGVETIGRQYDNIAIRIRKSRERMRQENEK